MADKSNIEWTDATVNFWWGCTKVGPGCDHCYAETWARRTGGQHWGVGVPRRKIKGAVALIHRLDNDYSEWAADYHCKCLPENCGSRRRVFIQSMSDLFDLEVPLEWFAEAWDLIERCNRIDIQILTKRISAVEKRLAAIGRTTWPKHAGLIVTVVNQEEADRDVPRLLALKAKLGIPWIGLSCEPLLGPIYLTRMKLGGGWYDVLGGWRDVKERFLGFEETIDWVIVGGESGKNARPMHLDWARSLRDQCAAAGVPFFFKQFGEWEPWSKHPVLHDNALGAGAVAPKWSDDVYSIRVGKKAAGRLLDGRTHDEFPQVRA
jgi:protein gp37